MSNIPLKWINFANKYKALSDPSKLVWMGKLSSKQQQYLNLVLKDLEVDKTKIVSAQKPAQHFDFKPSTLAKSVEVGEKSTSVKDVELMAKSDNSPNFQNQNQDTKVPLTEFSNNATFPEFSASTSDSNPKILNMRMIMPSQKFDLGIAAQAKNKLNIEHIAHLGNLSKSQYLKHKAVQMAKNGIAQAALIVLVLALPVGSIGFALNNSSAVKDIGDGKKSFSQVFAQPNIMGTGASDLEYKVWMADFSGLKEEQKTLNSDPDNDGLSNFEEFNLKTIPTNPQSCNNSKLDGENILVGIDPETCKPLNFNDPSVAAKFDGVVSRTKINYRLSLVALDKFLKPTQTPSQTVTTTSEIKETNSNIDYNENASLQIKAKDPVFKSELKYDIAWMQSTDISQLLDRVGKQIVSYPTKAIPGEPGNMYLSGKSMIKPDSDEVISMGVDIFTKLDRLEPGDILIFSLKTKDGQSKSFFYKVQTQNMHVASDPKQFRTSKVGNSELTLATPWTEYSPEQRLIVRATLEKVE